MELSSLYMMTNPILPEEVDIIDALSLQKNKKFRGENIKRLIQDDTNVNSKILTTMSCYGALLKRNWNNMTLLQNAIGVLLGSAHCPQTVSLPFGRVFPTYSHTPYPLSSCTFLLLSVCIY